MKKMAKKLLLAAAAACILTSVPQTGSALGLNTTAQAAVKISAKKATLLTGQRKILLITGTTKKVTWKSSVKTVATVSKKGVVRAKKAGKTVISAKVAGGKTYKCVITVKDKLTASPRLVVVKKIKVAKPGDTEDLEIYHSGDDGISWECDDMDVVSPKWSNKWDGDYTTLTLTGKKPGTANVRIYTDGNLSKTVKVTVGVYPLSVSRSKVKLNTVGDKTDIKFTYYKNSYVKFTVDKANVVSVKKSGSKLTLKALAKGTAKITLSTTDSKQKKTITVTVANDAVKTAEETTAANTDTAAADAPNAAASAEAAGTADTTVTYTTGN